MDDQNMNVWKVGSRWSESGVPESSIIDIFRKYQLVFAGTDPEGIKARVRVGDLVAVSDGLTIVAVGKVVGEPRTISEFSLEEIDEERIGYGDNVIGFKVKLIDLEARSRFDYRRGAFHAVKGIYRDMILDLWEKENQNKAFSILAKTCTFKYCNQQDGGSILDDAVRYQIPIYQRPYSWDEESIRKFISDIFASFWSSDGKIVEEPIFIGTMQLSEKKYIDNDECMQEVVDGQQRLSTFLILTKVLKTRYPKCQALRTVSLGWLTTRVNNGIQNGFLKKLIDEDLPEANDEINPYRNGAYIINAALDVELNDDQGNAKDFDVERFVIHLLSNIYFVVVETHAGLSKTIQIFHAINTTGLDLNGGDIFKIMMYQYLRDIKGQGDTSFSKISTLYEKIDNYNAKAGEKFVEIQSVLGVYQYVLIAKFDLPVVLYSYSVDLFYERLFDTILNNYQWDHFRNNLQKLEISLSEIDKVIEAFNEWENHSYQSAEEACMIGLLNLSRYSRYGSMKYIFLYRYMNEKNCDARLVEFMRQLSKLYTIYSIRYYKSINEIHSFTYSIVRDLINEPLDDVMRSINNKIGTIGDQINLQETLNSDITFNAKLKNIICRLSAMLDEDYRSKNAKTIEEIYNKVFECDIDIEHIQAYNDVRESERVKIWREWGEEINSLGNLIVLEQWINRSIGNESFGKKRTGYKESAFCSVQLLARDYQSWEKADSVDSRQRKAANIVDYLFSK